MSNIKMVLGIGVVILVVLGYMGWKNGSIEEVGNKFCPVSGRPIDGKSNCTVKGKKFNLCSPGCADKLCKDD